MSGTKVLVLNGPGLGQLGEREPDVYGSRTIDDLRQLLEERASGLGVDLEFEQHDSEGDLVRAVIRAGLEGASLIINPAAYSHYSIALLDALRAFGGMAVEVHLTHVFSREEYRRRLVTAEGCDALIAGMGFDGYLHALDFLVSAGGAR